MSAQVSSEDDKQGSNMPTCDIKHVRPSMLCTIMLEKQWRLPSQLLGEGSLPMRSPSVDWADRCLYECKECRPSETFDTHSKVSYHVKKRHCMAMKDYTTRHGRAMVYEEKHTCQVSWNQK